MSLAASLEAFRGRASITDAWSYRGFTAVVLENERLRCTVLPGAGARIVELVHKAAGRDLVYHHPRHDVRAPVFGVNVDDWWTGGIDEVAPTGHPCTVDGEQLPFLGEFWSQAWQHRIVEDGGGRVSVHLWASGIITPLRIDRWMSLADGEPLVRSRHRLTNLGEGPIEVMWGIHPGLSIRPGSRITIPSREGVLWEGHAELGVEPGRRFAWPRMPAAGGRTIDLSTARPPDPPSWELAFATDLTAGWLAVTDPPTRTGFAMAFDPAVLPACWLWGVYGGWRGLYTAAVEAWTSWPVRLDHVVDAGRQLTLTPGSTLETELMFICVDGAAEVTDVSPDGRVSGR